MRLPAEFDFESKKKKKKDDLDMGASAFEYGMKDSEKCEGKCCYDDDDEEEEEEDYYYDYPRHPTPPDGGWAWVVNFASFMCLLTVDGVCFSFPSLLPILVEHFGESATKTVWIGSTLSGTYLLAGFGLGMVFLPAVVAVGQWFDKKRAFATGLSYLGASVGMFLFPPLMAYLTEQYHWRSVLLFLAGIILNCAVWGSTFIPVEQWREANRHRRPINRKVEINRGDIMTALIESKKRERTISNGSLDNCVITRDNVLIKLDPKLFEGKRNNSIIARFRRQLGFSSQSLASSKNSLQGIPSIVIDAVNKDMDMKAKAAAAAAAANGRSSSFHNSPIYRPNGITRVQQLAGDGQEKRSSLPMIAKCSNPALLASTKLGDGVKAASKTAVDSDGAVLSSPVRVSKTRSCDAIPSNQMAPELIDSSGGGENPALTRSASDLQTHTRFLQFGPVDLENNDLRIQSIQLIPNGAHELAAAKAKGLRCRASRSESSTHSFGGFSYTGPGSAHASTVLYSSCTGSLPQIQANVEELELENSSDSQWSVLAQCVNAVMNMLQFRLLSNPVFALFAFSTFIAFLAMYIPFYWLPKKGETMGLPEIEQEFLISIIAATSAIGRLMAGWLSDRPWVSTFYIYFTTIFLSGVAMLCTPFCQSTTSLSLMAAFFGINIAASTTLRSILLIDFLGLEKLTKSFGLLSLVTGIAAMLGPTLAGEVMDQTNDIDKCFFLAGGLTILSGMIMLPNKCLKAFRDADSKMDIVGTPQLVQECGPITQTLTMEKLTATSVV
ncbi:monocarboxylate transporter [Elysia marginata]|uniref:Monocarboxylate transporter n=1 Tax=Elysia marginata TaxID=1093978 RepID=A0AAV4GL05_9GAST|nr:monocarboxylate transporter [Elysia marginata]